MIDTVPLIQKRERVFPQELIRLVERRLNYLNDSDNSVGCLWVRIEGKAKSQITAK